MVEFARLLALAHESFANQLRQAAQQLVDDRYTDSTESYDLSRVKRTFDDMCSHFDRILACDRQTDRQTTCDSIASRGKNCNSSTN